MLPPIIKGLSDPNIEVIDMASRNTSHIELVPMFHHRKAMGVLTENAHRLNIIVAASNDLKHHHTNEVVGSIVNAINSELYYRLNPSGYMISEMNIISRTKNGTSNLQSALSAYATVSSIQTNIKYINLINNAYKSANMKMIETALKDGHVMLITFSAKADPLTSTGIGPIVAECNKYCINNYHYQLKTKSGRRRNNNNGGGYY